MDNKPQRTQRGLAAEFNDITDSIIASAIEVHKILGPGLLEQIYEEALSYEFELRNIYYERQKPINLIYKGKNIGEHRIDFIVEEKVIVELKAVKEIHNIHIAQVITYLKAMDKKLGLLINFNVELLKLGLKRVINDGEMYE